MDIAGVVEDTIVKCFTENNVLLSKLVDAVVKAISAEMDKRLKTCEQEIIELRDTNKKLQMNIDSMEQYSRRTNVRIFGVFEDDRENVEEKVLDIVNNKIQVPIQAGDIDRCHRVAKRIDGKIRPILVKFTNYKFKSQVLLNRKNLKGSEIFVAEDLTKNRLNLLYETRNAFEKKNVWTVDGTVFVFHNNKKNIIKNSNDIFTLKITAKN